LLSPQKGGGECKNERGQAAYHHFLLQTPCYAVHLVATATGNLDQLSRGVDQQLEAWQATAVSDPITISVPDHTKDTEALWRQRQSGGKTVLPEVLEESKSLKTEPEAAAEVSMTSLATTTTTVSHPQHQLRLFFNNILEVKQEEETEVLTELQDIADLLEVPEGMVDCLESWEEGMLVTSNPSGPSNGLCTTLQSQFDLGGEELWAGALKTELEWMESLIRL
jgi:hypothetical protein